MRYAISLMLAFSVALAVGLGSPAHAADSAAAADKYPADTLKALREGCMKAKDVPADKVQAVCSCYTATVQMDIPYATFARVGETLKTKGPQGLDEEGKTAMEKNAFDVNYCRLKYQAVGSEEERATFPAADLPALHNSCMAYPDIPDSQKPAFCKCYEGLIKTKITYSDWVLLRLAIQIKGVKDLDKDEARIFNDVRVVRLDCGGTPAKQ